VETVPGRVEQSWLSQLPSQSTGRLRHGVRIDPQTLRGEARFYGDADPNCCQSQVLLVDLVIRDNRLLLRAPPRLRDSQR
jgi:hypothetical protein